MLLLVWLVKVSGLVEFFKKYKDTGLGKVATDIGIDPKTCYSKKKKI